MARLSRLGLSSSNKQGPNVPATSISPAEPEKVRLFADLMLRAEKMERCIILDFAPASPQSIALFNQLQCRVDIIGMNRVLKPLIQSQDAKEFAGKVKILLNRINAHPPNVILCWDFLNYLPRGGISILMDEVAKRSQNGALVHALMAYTSPEMPALPCRYTPMDKESLLVQPQVDKERKSPRYAPKELLRCLPRYELDHAALLRNGYQEYILRLER